jgi:hypothetical protein
MLTAVALCFITQARADAQTVPADTATFVSYCTDANWEACRLKVVDVNNAQMINQLFNKHGCSFPIDEATKQSVHDASIVATKAILPWLRANSATRAPKTDSAIVQAIAALWPNKCVH